MYIRFRCTCQNWLHMPVHIRVWLLSFILVTQNEVFRIRIKYIYILYILHGTMMLNTSQSRYNAEPLLYLTTIVISYHVCGQSVKWAL